MNKKRLLVPGFLIALLVSVVFVPVGSEAGQKGEWEISTTMEIPGMPFAMPATTMRKCLEDKGVPYGGKDDEKCKVESSKVSGDTVTWKVVCDGPEGQNEITGVSKYTSDTMDTRIQMKNEEGDISMHMTGRRLGPCR
ncbi:MAG: DUF3617 domain-containing protein [Proteobacteria bacterium]|nr:DUF3617 domain-containing protein [Pseudomonadota bacterium]MBU1737341.1 DUF3617 domain-containing protein [Pseudomonadota bacterium]